MDNETKSNEENKTPELVTTSVIFTDSAAEQVKMLIEKEQTPTLMLRVFISGGGCSGFQYGFSFEEEQCDDDFVIYKNGVKVVIDAMSHQFLDGAEIDYKNGLQGSQFVIRNPNVTSTCGCGSSFGV